MRLRRAELKDLDAIVAIKEALPLDPRSPSRRGGFLLGCPRERYAGLIQTAEVRIVEENRVMGGFAIALPNALLRTSDLWERRDLIRWHGENVEPPSDEPTAYFDQLALRPGWPRLHGLVLALAMGRTLAESEHAHLYATILHRPVRNEAALPLLRAVGGQAVGLVDETYDGVGPVVSELHHVRLLEGLAAVTSTAIGMRALRTLLRVGSASGARRP